MAEASEEAAGETANDDLQLLTTLRYDPVLAHNPDNAQFVNSPECALYMLSAHERRLRMAAAYLHFTRINEMKEDVYRLEQAIMREIEAARHARGADAPYKVRVLRSRDDVITVTVDPTPLTAVPITTLFPPTFDLPPVVKVTPPVPSPFTPFPLTGGALTLGPTDAQPVPPDDDVGFSLTVDILPTPVTLFTNWKSTDRTAYNTARERTFPLGAPMTHEVIMFDRDGLVTEGTFTTVYFFRDGCWVTPKGGMYSVTKRWAVKQRLCIAGDIKAETIHTGERCWVSNAVRGFVRAKVVEAWDGLQEGDFERLQEMERDKHAERLDHLQEVAPLAPATPSSGLGARRPTPERELRTFTPEPEPFTPTHELQYAIPAIKRQPITPTRDD